MAPPPPVPKFMPPPPPKKKSMPPPMSMGPPGKRAKMSQNRWTKHNSVKPTRVVLMRNMVGRGEVDPDLEGEISEECRKYGIVLKCVVHEIKSQLAPEDEAVRIFVQFGSLK